MRESTKRSVLVVTGSRSEYGYLRPVLQEMLKSSSLEPRLLVTGMHTQKKFGHTLDEIEKEIPVTCTVPVGEDDSMLEALSKEIVGIEEYCVKNRPDLIMVIGDRDEGFAAAIVGGHLGIPIAHLAGGDVTGFGVDEPIRHSISKFANVHFVWSPLNAKRLEALGEEPWRIYVTGSTAFDELREITLLNRSELAEQLHLRTDAPWMLVLQHPTPLDPTPLSEQLHPTIEATRTADVERIFIYPNSDTGYEKFIKAIEQVRTEPNVHIFESLPHETYLALLKHSSVLVGNSSSGILEAGYFQTPVVNIGERQKGREHGANVIHVSYTKDEIERAIQTALSDSFIVQMAQVMHPYDRGYASNEIVRVLENLPLDQHLMYKQLSSNS